MTNAQPALTKSQRRLLETELLELLELELKAKARNSLTEFVKQIDVPGAPVSEDLDETKFYEEKLIPARHHELIIEALEAVDSGDVKRLMIFMPPGSAKSTYGTVCFPSWWLGKNPKKSIISCSYGGDLAKKFGRKCRQITRSKEYKAIFDTTLRGDNAAADEWSLENGSEYMATGIMSSVTGNRAYGLVIDDPIKGREDADSPTIRDKTWEAYKSDLRTRLIPNVGFIIMILTRWHEDDPAGRILPEDYNGETGWITARDGEEWYVLALQAECERDDDPLGRKVGEYIWPEWFGKEHFDQEKLTQGPRNWSALYQQRPAPEEGDYFQKDWIQWYEWDASKENNGAPKHLKFYGASDYATKKNSGDWTVHGVAGEDPNADLYIIDWWRKQETPDIWVDQFLDMAQKWNTSVWAEESGQILNVAEPIIQRIQRERNFYPHRKQFPSVADKAARAQSIRGRMSAKKVYFPRNAPWTDALISEMMRFTGATGDIDDQVDVLGMFGRMIGGMQGGKVPPKPKTLKKVTLDDLWKDHEQGLDGDDVWV